MTCGQKIRPVFSVTLGAPIAQLDRASDYGSEGYRFNSYWVRQLQPSEHQAFLFLHREPHKNRKNVLGQFLANFRIVARLQSDAPFVAGEKFVIRSIRSSSSHERRGWL